MTAGSAQHSKRLTRNNAVLLLVDHQVGLYTGVRQSPRCGDARWTQDPAIAKRVQETATEASSEFAAKCASRPHIKMLADLPAAYPKGKNPLSSGAPVSGRRGDAAQMPVTLDDWHRALGFYKCATCGVPIGNGIRFAWIGKNRWCETCFWGDESQSASSDVLPDANATEEEKKC